MSIPTRFRIKSIFIHKIQVFLILQISLDFFAVAKNSSLAVEALAGLASTEDFGALTLKNVDVEATGYGNKLPPHKDVMLILVKGRRHVQVRLVEPVVASINSGDNFILVTRNEVRTKKTE